jgi:hypothetical protein
MYMTLTSIRRGVSDSLRVALNLGLVAGDFLLADVLPEANGDLPAAGGLNLFAVSVPQRGF